MDSVAFKMNFIIDLRHTEPWLLEHINRAKQLGSIQPTDSIRSIATSNRGRKHYNYDCQY